MNQGKRILFALIAMLVVALAAVAMFVFTRSTQPATDSQEQPEVATTTSVRTFSAEDLYAAGPDTPTQAVALTEVEAVVVNALRGLPTDGNVLKVHTVCIDDSTGTSYAAGIMTSDIAVIENGKTTSYIHTGLGGEGLALKYLYCGGGNVVMADERNIVSVDPLTGETRAQVKTSASTVPEMAFLDDAHGLFILATPKPAVVTIYDAATLAVRKTLPAGAGRNRWFVAGDRLLEVSEQREAKTMTATWYDAATFTAQDTKTINVAFGTMGYDAQADALWIAARGKVMQVPLGVAAGDRLSFLAPEDVKQVMVASGKVLVVSQNGYDSADEPGFMGGLLIADAATGKLERTIKLPWKHSHVEATEDGEAILVNNDGNSVSLIDLASGDARVVAVGSAAETVAIDGEGNLYIGNRLGGSTIPVVSPSFEKRAELAPEAWPVGLAYSATLDRIFSYNMLGSSVSVIDPSEPEIVEAYGLGVADGATDALAALAFDKTHDVLFAAIPEQFAIVALDAQTGGVIDTITLPQALTRDVDVDDLSGPGSLLVAVHEPTMTLFVYAKWAKQLLTFDGLNGFAAGETISLTSKEFVDFPFALFIDQSRDRLFFGSQVFDVKTLSEIGRLPEGAQYAFGIDAARGVLFAVGLEAEQETLYAISADLSETLDTIALPADLSVRTRGFYDEGTGRIYAAYTALAQVGVFDVF
ncbi:hypothetical protein HY631_01755 [Candidatus Uhrbacteria bacterium]|nr:hypothetical protein [Candidatus Uhrbacteria bacterium]